MIPILFPANEFANGYTAFQSNGLGGLSDAASCIVTEELNGEYELEMEYPTDGIHFSEIEVDTLIYCKPNDTSNFQIFRVYQISKPLNDLCTINAEHISYQLNKSIVFPYTSNSASEFIRTLNSKEPVLWQGNNASFLKFPFTFETDSTAEGEIKIEAPKSIRSALFDEFLDVYGADEGEFEFDNFNVIYHSFRGNREASVTLRYGKNITKLDSEEDMTDAFTGIVPYWKGSIRDFKAVDTLDEETGEFKSSSLSNESKEVVIYLTEDKGTRIVWDPVDPTAHFYPMLTTMDFSSDIDVAAKEEEDPTNEEDDKWKLDGENPDWSDIADAHNAYENEVVIPWIREELLRLTNEYYQKNKETRIAKHTIKVSFVPLWETEEYKDLKQFEHVSLGDSVNVYYPKFNLSVNKRVVKTEYNVLLDRYEEIEVGDRGETAGGSITSSIANSAKDVSQGAAKALDDAANAIKNNLGYYESEAYQMAKADAIKRAKEYADKTTFVHSKEYADQLAEAGRTAWELFGSNDSADDITAEWAFIKAAKKRIQDYHTEMQALEQALNDLDAEMAEHEQTMSEYEQTMAEHEQTMADLNTDLSDLDAELDQAKIDAANNVTQAISDYNTALDQTVVFNKLTKNGSIQGMTKDSNGNLYFNASYINAGTINGDYINAGTLRADRLVTNSISSDYLGDLAVTSAKLGNSAVTEGKINAGAVTEGKIGTGAVTTNKIGTGAITSVKLGPNSVTAGKIDANAVTASCIAAGAVTAGKIDANAVTAGTIAAGAVTAGKIDANAVTAGCIAANAVTAGTVAAGAVTAGTVAAGAVTGNLITGGTISGVTFQATGPATSQGDTLSLRLEAASTAVKSYWTRGSNNQTLLASVIDMGQYKSSRNTLCIDAKRGIHIRTPELYVNNQSYIADTGSTAGQGDVFKTGNGAMTYLIGVYTNRSDAENIVNGDSAHRTLIQAGDLYFVSGIKCLVHGMILDAACTTSSGGKTNPTVSEAAG